MLIVAFYILSYLGTGQILARWKWLRKFILREKFIEGTWIESIVPANGERMISRITISFERDKIKLQGMNYNLKGKEIGSFSTEMACFKWPRIDYQYNWTRFDDSSYDIDGIGYIRFTGSGNEPLTYNGHYFTTEGSRCCISGTKITKEDEIQSLNDPRNNSEMISKYAKIHPSHTVCRETNICQISEHR